MEIFEMLRRFSIFLAALVLGGFLMGSAALAQLAPGALLKQESGQFGAAQPTKMVCFWKNYNATTPLGESGFCHQSSDAPVGNPCACHTPDGRLRFGVSIEAPVGD